jgi:hypothetical protein
MIIVPIEENHVGLASATDAKFRAPDTSGSGLEALVAGLAKLGDGGQHSHRRSTRSGGANSPPPLRPICFPFPICSCIVLDGPSGRSRHRHWQVSG